LWEGNTLRATFFFFLVTVSISVGTNKPINKNATVQHCGSDHDSKGGNPNE
jgi:hypothetical protein